MPRINIIPGLHSSSVSLDKSNGRSVPTLTTKSPHDPLSISELTPYNPELAELGLYLGLIELWQKISVIFSVERASSTRPEKEPEPGSRF